MVTNQGGSYEALNLSPHDKKLDAFDYNFENCLETNAITVLGARRNSDSHLVFARTGHKSWEKKKKLLRVPQLLNRLIRKFSEFTIKYSLLK